MAQALTALILIGFAPVAWVFTQSTDSLAFMGALHLLFLAIALRFGLRPLLRAAAKDSGYLKLWGLLFVLVSLQMTTTLRPFLGTAPTLLPIEKKIFLLHWKGVRLFSSRASFNHLQQRERHCRWQAARQRQGRCH